MKRVAVAVLVSLSAAQALASSEPAVPIEARAKAARRIVVGTVVETQSRFHVNGFGDRLIVTDATVEVEETLKGPSATHVLMLVEGGTVGDLTLHVSDMPALRRGDRAVLFLDPDDTGRHVPHGRGLGIVKLDQSGRAPQADTTLAEIRSRVRAAAK